MKKVDGHIIKERERHSPSISNLRIPLLNPSGSTIQKTFKKYDCYYDLPKILPTKLAVARDDQCSSISEHLFQSRLKGICPGKSILSGSTKMNTDPNRSVSFHSVQIREYERCLGDNPCVSSGPAISIGWRHTGNGRTFLVNDYETNRAQRRRSTEMLIPRHVREDMLHFEYGVSRSQISRTVKNINNFKAQRRQTVNNLNFEVIEEMFESAKRRLVRTVKRRGKRKEQNLLWINAQGYIISYSCNVTASLGRTCDMSITRPELREEGIKTLVQVENTLILSKESDRGDGSSNILPSVMPHSKETYQEQNLECSITRPSIIAVECDDELDKSLRRCTVSPVM